MNQKITRSASKHIRQEKARIRREVSDPVKKEEMIKQLYTKFNPVTPKEIVSQENPKPKSKSKPKTPKKVSKKEGVKKESKK